MKPLYLMSILSGLLIGTSYIPFPPWAFFFCLVPLFSAWLRAKTYKEIFWCGWLTQFVMTLVGMNWVSYTVHTFGHMPWPIAIIVLLIFCSFANLYVPLVGMIWFWVSRKRDLGTGGNVAALVILLSVGERIFPMIFDWHFGYAWIWAGFPAMHLADMIGFIGISNIVIAMNGLSLMAFLERQAGRRWWPWIAAVPTIFVIMNVWGYFHSQLLPQPGAKANFLIVQANIGNQDKVQAEKGWAYRDTILDRFMGLTQKGIDQGKPIDFVVWPETSFPEIVVDPNMTHNLSRKLRDRIELAGVKLISGGYGVIEERGKRKATNALFILDQNGRWLTEPYHKSILLAFGEYVPGGKYIPQKWIDKYVPEIGDFGRGPGPTVVDAAGFKLGIQICYEGLFDWFTRQLGNKGADILVNVTNDSWYGKTGQVYQHLYMTLARAIEVRRPLVRSTNTGISTVILANGQILERSPLHEEWFYLYEIPYIENAGKTVFMKWGFWVIPGLLALAFLIVLLKGNRGRVDA